MFPYGLPEYMLSELRADFTCERCGRSDQVLAFERPSMQQTGIYVLFVYRYTCPCGDRGCLRVGIPALFYGFILAKLAILAANKRRRRSSVATVTKGPSKYFRILLRDFEAAFDKFCKSLSGRDLMTDPPDSEEPSGPRPTELDRLRFNFRIADWQDFLRRMGFADSDDRADP